MARFLDKRRINDINEAVHLAAWPTRDWKDGSPNANVPVNALLGREVWAAGWPTPMAGTPAQKGYNEAGNNDSSRKTVALAGWNSPAASDGNGGKRPHKDTPKPASVKKRAGAPAAAAEEPKAEA